jgi:predicted nuclease of predicted toxin-antitoxin system
MEIFSFLVDVNLPKFFGFFNTPNFSFVADLNLMMSDNEIWDYALTNELVILTKDTDFYDKCLLSETSPKIIHFQIGNYSLKQLHTYFTQHWQKILLELPTKRK